MEYFIAGAILIISIAIVSKNIRKKTSGKCDCDSCPSHCSVYNNKKK